MRAAAWRRPTCAVRERACARAHRSRDASNECAGATAAACNVRLRRAAPGCTTSRPGVGKVQDQRVRIRIIVEQTPVLRLEFLPQGPSDDQTPSEVGAGGRWWSVLCTGCACCGGQPKPSGAVDRRLSRQCMPCRRTPSAELWVRCVLFCVETSAAVVCGPTVRRWRWPKPAEDGRYGVPGTEGAAGAGRQSPPARPSPRSTPVATPTRAAASTREPAAGSAAAHT